MATAGGNSDIGWVTVFTGSSFGTDAVHAEAATALGRTLAERGIGLVYGGGKVGLMGTVADAVLAAGGEVVGVIPQFLVDGEVGHDDLTRLEIVDSMHERKQRMAEVGDAFVALPGGAGTLDEFFEAWTWQHLGLHAKPVALLNVQGFWRPLLDMIDATVAAGFVDAARRDALIVAETPDDLMAKIEAFTPPPRKWAPR